MKPLQESETRRLIRCLDEEIRSRGHGSIRAVDRAVGYKEGWWQHRAASGEMTVSQLLKVLDHLGLDPVSFMRRVLGERNELELDRPRGTPPTIVVKAWERHRSGVEGSGVGERYLETLDRQRYEEPEEVVRLAEWAVDHVELELLPCLLGVVGSALRLLVSLDEAEHAVGAGLDMCQTAGDRSGAGRLLQRLAYVSADRGDRSKALKITEAATAALLRCGDRQALWKSIVDQGMWLHYLNRFEESIATHELALSELAEGAARNRCTALQFIGLGYQQLEDPERAHWHLAEAEAVAASAGLDDWSKAKLRWLRAGVLTSLGQLDEAAQLLSATVEDLCKLHPGEAALAACDLVRLRIGSRQAEEALVVARSMRRLVEPLRHNRIISAAVAELVRCEQSGLSLALVQRIAGQIKGERKNRRSWQLLKTNRSR